MSLLYLLQLDLQEATLKVDLVLVNRHDDRTILIVLERLGITHELHRGVTVLDGKGWYTKAQTEVLMVLTRKSDLSLLLRVVKTVDPDAFLSVSSVTGVYGKGFDRIKEKVKGQKEILSKES